MRTILRGVIAAVALSLTPVAVVTVAAPPATAAATVATTTSFDPDIRKRGEAGAFLSITGSVEPVEDPNCTFVSVGDTFLQRQAPGTSTFKNVAKDTSPSFLSFPDYDKYTGNAKFRLAYTGGVASESCTYAPSVSEVISLKVLRRFDIQSVSGKRQPTADIKVSPKFGNKLLLVQKKQGGKFKTFRKVKTNQKGKVRLSLEGSRQGIDYRLVAPKDKNFVATKAIVTATRF